jgi:hypothetical protein
VLPGASFISSARFPRTLDPAVRSSFATVPKAEWALSGDTPKQYRALLHAPRSFEALIRDLCAHVKVIDVCRDKAQSFPGYYRAEVTILVRRLPCTAFHSARFGYRAQYYASIRNGETANAFAVSSLVVAILSQLRNTNLMTKAWIERSLLGRDSKVWIHQGQWLRFARRRDRLLMVQRWMRKLSSLDSEHRRLARWSTLVPRQEHALDIKGAFLTLAGKPLRCAAKPERGKQLHEIGFT